MRLIDADALLDMLKFLANKKYNRELTTPYSNAYKECMGFIKCAPTIALHHVEIKRGRWKGKPIAGYSTVRCSECGGVFMENNGKWNYCPNCGTKMDEVEDGTN